MFLKLHELIVLLAIGALLLIIATGFLVKNHFFSETPRFPLLSTAVYSIVEAPEKLYHLLSSLGSSPFELDDRFPEQSGFVGETNRQELYLLLNRYDGDTEQGVVELIDLRSFEVLHRWEPDHQTSDSGYDETVQSHREIRQFYADVMTKHATHSSLLPEGNLVVGRDNGSISKFDACSHPLWQTSISDGVLTNASLELDDRGNTWVTAAQKLVPPEFRNTGSAEKVFPSHSAIDGRMYIDNSIVQISPTGEVIYSKSISDIFLANRLLHLLLGFSRFYSRDPMHLVDIQPALTDGTHWQNGDLLISLKHLSLVLLYRPSTDQLLWHSIGHTSFQGDVEFAGDSKIVMFDNNTPAYLEANAEHLTEKDLRFKVVNGHNKVLVYDFNADRYSHHLDDALRTNEVRSTIRGRSQLLPNGDLYVEESEYGRLLYLSSDGRTHWSYVNRAKDKKVYATGSSRLLYRDHETGLVRGFLAEKDQLIANCNNPPW